MNLRKAIGVLGLTFVSAVLTTLLLVQRHAGFILMFVLIVLIPWWIYSGFAIARKPEIRSVQIGKVVVWIVAVGIIVAVHCYRYATSRQYAQDVVDRIHAYERQHKSYPADLSSIGISQAQLQSALGYSGYLLTEGSPIFFYATTYMPFETERYDFETHDWQHVSD